MDLKNLLSESANQYKTLQTEAVKLTNKWSKTGLLAGVTTDTEQNYMAMVLENQAKQLVTESNQTGLGGSTFTGGQGDQWSGIALPLVRKVFGEISAKEFVSVQTMNVPSGLVFFLEFKYGTRQPELSGRFKPGDSLYGTSNIPNVGAKGGIYGAGRFGYSMNEVSQAVTASAAIAATGSTVNFDGRFNALTGSLSEIRVPITGTLTVADLDEVRSFTVFPASAVGTANEYEAKMYPEFTKISGSFDNIGRIVPTHIVFVMDNSIVADFSAAPVVVEFYRLTRDNDRGDFEDRAERRITGSHAIPEISIEMRSESLTAKTRKLKASWTPEFSQDLNAYQNIDAEAELTSMLSQYIGMEIDMEILDMLIMNANTVDYWSVKNNTFLNNQGVAVTSQAGNGFMNSQGGWYSTLGQKINKVSNIIHQKTMRGGANFIVTSPVVSGILESIAGYAVDTDGTKAEYNMGVAKVGTFSSRWKVYKNPYMQENLILMGYKGQQFLETGAVYAPYIPLIMTPLVYDPETFTPKKGLMTRYAKKMVRPEFYAKIYVTDLDLV